MNRMEYISDWVSDQLTKGKSYAELAEYLGVSTGTVWNFLRGTYSKSQHEERIYNLIKEQPAVDAIGNKVAKLATELNELKAAYRKEIDINANDIMELETAVHELSINANGHYRELQSGLSKHINLCGDERLEFLSLRERVKTLEGERVVMKKEINLLFDHLNEMETPKTGIVRRFWRWLW